MKKAFLFIISLLVGVGLFVWILKVVGWQEIKDTFLAFTIWQGLVILGLTALIMVFGTWKWKEILRGEGVNVSFRELLGPYLAGFAVMFLVPILVWGGEIFRSYTLKERSSVPFAKGLASVVIDRILEWTANLLVIFFGALFFLLSIDFPPTELAIIFGGAFSLFFVAIALFYFKIAKRESVVRWFLPGNKTKPFDAEKEIFKFFKWQNKFLWRAVFWSFARSFVMYLRVWVLILFLGKTLGLLPILSVLGFSYLAVMIPIPTALGSHEAIQIFAFTSLGLGGSVATAFTMIVRGAEVIVSLAGVFLLFRLGVLLVKDMMFKKVEQFTQKEDEESRTS